MKTLLLLNLYFEKHDARRAELEACVRLNMQAGFDNVLVVCEAQDIDYARNLLKEHQNVKFELCGQRPTFDDYFYFTNIEADDQTLVFISNTDIVFLQEELTKIKSLNWTPNISLALSRWDVLDYDANYNILNSEHLSRADSQDTWVHLGKCRVTHAPYMLGTPGNDNCVAMRYLEADYKVVNPSVDIKTYHFHKVTVRNYYNEEGKVVFRYEPPYWLVHPCRISDI